ncbi:MAG TPA: YciI family protein [Candidatus Saccharimonadales bacterium]|nr:YciI family protein [Candidatus Saccharimonadales bacterium]
MQFIVIAKDYKDALQRRLGTRAKHIELGDKLVLDGKALYGVALLDEKGEMNGSVYVMEFPTREELDEWLKTEPYVTGKVWEHIEIIPCQVGPSFTK